MRIATWEMSLICLPRSRNTISKNFLLLLNFIQQFLYGLTSYDLVTNDAYFFHFALDHIAFLKENRNGYLFNIRFCWHWKSYDTLRYWGGLAKAPTPGGVPVKMISPGSRVQNLLYQT